MKPIERRIEEAKIRLEAVDDMRIRLKDYEKKGLNFNLTMPWVKEEEKLKLVRLNKLYCLSLN